MNIAVIGSGQMGTGIAQVIAVAGHEVWLFDRCTAVLETALAGITRRIERAMAKGIFSVDTRDLIMERIHTSIDLMDMVSLDIAAAIEAIPEVFSRKKELFERLDDVLPVESIFASNTSSISITQLAALTRRPERVIGMHFMYPVPVMELVEVIRGVRTSQATIAFIQALARECGKTAVLVDDQPGFVSNRILLPMINEAVFALSEGVADVAGIDTIMTLGMHHPMGPLALADFIGLDTCLSILEVLYEGFGDSKYRPAPLLRRMVIAERLGRKTGEGFYNYSPTGERLEPCCAEKKAMAR